MTALNQLYPQPLWQWFETICSIPHPSKHEQMLSQYIQNWVTAQGLSFIEDHVGNLIIKKPATSGMENRQIVCIQAHLDMVPQKNSDKEHNFENDPIEAFIDGDWVTANGTTLGADNGIGMSSALAILGSNDIKHGPLEILLTIDEEAGMTGAFGLQAGVLEADILINTDSEQEGEIYMGCAGGVDAEFKVPMAWEGVEPSQKAFKLDIKGLKGGHSGVNIHMGRGNANKLLARFLFGHADELGLELASISGGSLRNAIPREAEITFTVPVEKVELLNQRIDQFDGTVRAELAIADPGVSFILSEATTPEKVMAEETQDDFIALLNATPNGVIRMSDDVNGVVETSLNVGVITTENESVNDTLLNSLIN